MNNKQEQAVLQFINKKQYTLLQNHSNLILDILSREENQRILNSERNFRVRHYSPLKTLGLFIEQVMSADKSCNNAISGLNIEQLVTEQEVVCSNTGSYVKARKRLSEWSIYNLVKSIGCSSLGKSTGFWTFHGRVVKGVDGFVLTMPDTKANVAQYPKHSNQKECIGYPQARLLAVFSLATGSVIDYAIEPTKGKGTGEINMLRSVLDSFNEGDVVVGDALFCNFFLTHDLQKKNVDILTPNHVQRRHDFSAGTILGERDHIIEWNRPRRPQWMSKELYKTYPKTILIREFKVNDIVYSTTLIDASIYSKEELCELYRCRWDVELHIRNLKTIMGMEMLSCQDPDMVRKEIGVHFLAHNIIREIMLDGGIKQKAQPTKISFKKTLQLANQVIPRMSLLNNEEKVLLYSQLIELVVKNKVGNRPGRVEPRAIRKRKRTFPVLKNDRKTAKGNILMRKEKYLDESRTA
jgi:hypothetical protein